ncbi:MAG: enoyl-CoA hydratase/isomerase family protein [Proteobacteria bacterium]|nr:enoyl-CoA hydratase/isomerase family protein [Pseudomonadota bacterium]
MSDVITSTRAGALAQITIERPGEGNQLTIAMIRDLAAAFRAASASDAKIILLRGRGPDFCKGRDGRGGAPAPNALAMRADVCEPVIAAYDCITNARQPVICAVQGAAFGFGAAIACACDVTLAADDAKFMLPEMRHDLPPTLAMSALLGKVGRKAIAHLVYSLDTIDAARARDVGLVSAVVAAGELDAAVGRLVAAMSERSAAALTAVKDFLRSAPHMEPRGVNEYATNLLAAVLTSAGR